MNSTQANGRGWAKPKQTFKTSLAYLGNVQGPMSRYKGRVSARAIERDFPHVVETVVPKGGLGKTLDAMHEFHKLHGIDAHTGKGQRDKNGHDYIRWCFTNPGIAAKFKSQFVRG
jgi:hypothetical protein